VNIVYDEFTDQYIIGYDNDLIVHNSDWSVAREVSLLPIKNMRYPVVYKIACNKKYYVINYGNESYSDDYRNFTAVFTKRGKQVSITETPHYEVLQINRDNIIYSVPQRVPGPMMDSIKAPVAITCTNIHQDIVKKIQIGRPYVIANSISFTDNDELVVSGTSATTSSRKLPKTPDGVYFYKEQQSK
jgi:hypothetical protein